jgi:hypothetical protein
LEDNVKAPTIAEVHPNIARLNGEIEKVTAEAEAAGEEGEIDKAQVYLLVPLFAY